ncbi:hypothetical protein [Limnoglobus roseus]|uniref:hypothetical protein n=1 Tax=Limnoglobus roseus TaxID=2598579 RepID=UPI00143CE0FC|nr:hypothetical protein [Limnoglobus roseus]
MLARPTQPYRVVATDIAPAEDHPASIEVGGQLRSEPGKPVPDPRDLRGPTGWAPLGGDQGQERCPTLGFASGDGLAPLGVALLASPAYPLASPLPPNL